MDFEKGKIWFGTPWNMEWIDCTLRGTDVSPQNWNASGTFLSGGGYALNSAGSHREYQFEWKGASSLEAASKMQLYASGFYSLSQSPLLYHVDPMMLKGNFAPPILSQPWTMAEKSPSGVTKTPMGKISDRSITPGIYRRVEIEAPTTPPTELSSRGVFIPYIPGKVIRLRASVTGTGDTGVYYREFRSSGSTLGPEVRIPSGAGVALDWSSRGYSATGVFVYFQGGFTLSGMFVGLEEVFHKAFRVNGQVVTLVDPVLASAGLGNTGTRMVGMPTQIINSTATHEGQIGYAVTLKEVGAWFQ